MSDPYLTKNQHGKWELNPHQHEVTVNIGTNQYVVIDKLFGPLCASDIRVHLNFEACAWIVEERNFHNNEWVERARFDAQEFYKDQYNTDDGESV